MTRYQLSIRIDRAKKDKLEGLAKLRGVNYSDLIRDKIDELLNHNISSEVKEKVLKIIRELREPFAYIRIEPHRSRAIKERAIREGIAKKLEEVFNL